MEKVLIIRFSSIGDIVLTTPLVRCLKQQWPEASVHYLTKKQFGPVLQSNPYIDKIHLYDHNFRELIPQLKSEGFSRIIDLHRNYRSAFVKQHFRVPAYTFPKINVRKWMRVHLKVNLLPDIHIVERYFSALREMGIKNDRYGLDYFIPPNEAVSLSELPETHRNGYAGIVIGAKHHTKIFPAEKVADVCSAFGKPVLLLGGPEDRERGEKVLSMTSNSMVINTCGQYSINQSASLVMQASVIVSNDTGLMHIAAAFNKPVVSVWGNTIPGFGMFPLYPDNQPSPSLMIQADHLRCRPCSKLGHAACPKGHFRCMNDLEIGPIVDFMKAQCRRDIETR